MREMHWSWTDLCAAPADLVQEALIRIAAEADAYEMKQQREAGKRQGAKPGG